MSSTAYTNTDQKQRGTLYKLAILGDGGVGKTALTIQLCLNQFVETYDPTIEDSYRKKLLIDTQPVTLEILDTAGQEEYAALRDQWIRDAEGFLLVYSITSRESFSRISQYYEQIARVKEGEDYACTLVANKCDRNDERTVTVNEGKQLAKELDSAFFETSAKLNINAEAAFIACARETRDLRQRDAKEAAAAAGTTPSPEKTEAQPEEKPASATKKDKKKTPSTKSETSKPKKKKCCIM